MKNPFRFMPMYWEEYMIHAMDLSPAEYGALMLITGRYWMTGGPLPNDDRMLAATTRQSLESWLEMRPVVMRFFDVRDGMLVSSRLEKILSDVRARAEKQRKNAMKRWAGSSVELERVVIPMRRAGGDDDPF